ncbi:hypothetical protein RhiirA1_489459 [Rhizophagus irregularis]|nr:hypothetical protein RhiirA1_489459 [Rhizophagus irregularis]
MGWDMGWEGRGWEGMGGDFKWVATMFKTYLIYEMLLKLGLFFIFGLALEASVTGLTFLIQIIGYRSFSLIWSVFVYNNFGRGLKDRLNQKDKEEPVFYLRLFKVYLKDRDSGFLTNIFRQSLKKYCKEVEKKSVKIYFDLLDQTGIDYKMNHALSYLLTEKIREYGWTLVLRLELKRFCINI